MAYLGYQPATGANDSFKVLDDIKSYTLTFDGSSSSVVSVADDTITSNEHRFIHGQKVTYNKGGGTKIAGLDDGSYYVIIVDTNTIKLSASSGPGGAVNITGVGGGTSHTLNVAFDGVNTKFKPTYDSGTTGQITRAAQLVISLNGVIQQPVDSASPSSGFGLDSGNIVFSEAPTTADTFWGHILTKNLASFEVSDNKVDNFTGDGSATEFTLSKSPANSDNVIVTIDGVVQYPSTSGNTRAYQVNDNSLVFSSAPVNGAAIQARHIGFAGSVPGTSGVTGFYGRTGNVALVNTDNIVANDATFSGNVSIAKTLTYADVTNIDSVGIVTARGDIHVGENIAHKDDTDTKIVFTDNQIDLQTGGYSRAYLNNWGLYIRSGFGLSFLASDGPSPNIKSGGTNARDLLLTTGTDNPTRIQIAEGGNVGIGSAIPTSQLDIKRANISGTYPDGNAKPSGASIFNDGGDIFTGRLFLQGTARSASADFLTGINNEGNVLVMYDYGHSKYMQKWHKEAQVELMYNGNIKLNTRTDGVKITGGTDISMNSDGTGQLYMTGNGYTGGIALDATAMNIYHNSGSRAIIFGTNEDEKVRIDSTGRLLVGTDAGWGSSVKLHLASTGNTYAVITAGTSGNSVLAFSDDGSERGSIDYDHDGDKMLFKTAAGERLRITSEGYLKLAGTIANSNNKLGRFLMPSHDSSEEDVMYMQFQQEDAYNQLEFGGGSSSYNAATRIIFRTAAIDTTTGAERLRIDSGGTIRLQRSTYNTGAVTVNNAALYLDIGSTEGAANANQLIGFGYRNNTTSAKPAYIGYKATDWSSHTKGDLIFGTRGTTTATDEAIERLRITSDGKYYFPGTGGGSGSRGLEIDTESVGAADEGVILNARASGVTGRIKFQTNSKDAMTILGNGGFVGVGTDNPESGQLQVIGNGYHQINISANKTADANKTSGISFLNYEGNRTSLVQTYASSSSSTIYYGSADSSARGVQYHNFYVNSSRTATTNHKLALRIQSDGEVRIGGNEGGYKTTIIDESNRTTTAETQLLLYAKHDGSGNTGVGFGGGIKFWGDRNSDNAEQTMGNIMCVADVNSGTNLSGALSFETSSAGVPTQKLRITSGGDIVVGNFTPVDTRNTGGIHIQDNHGISFKSHSSASSRNWRIRNDDWGWGNLDFGVGTSNSDWSDDASETVLSLTSSRRVGINEVTPDRDLHISNNTTGGIIRLTNTDTTITDGTICGMLEFEQRDTNTPGVSANIRAEMQDTTNGANKLCFSTGTPSTIGTRMVIDSKGCVRIGNEHTQTTSGNTKRIALGGKGSIWGWVSGQIDGSINLADNYYWDGANNRAIEAADAAYLALRLGTLRFGTTDSTPSAGGVTGLTEKFRIAVDGNVGINQNNPNKAKLHVVADTGVTNRIVAKFRNPQGDTDVRAKIGFVAGYSDTANDTEGQAYIGAQREGNGNNAALFFETSDGSTLSEKLHIASDGKLILKNNSSKMIDCRTSSATGSNYIQLSKSDGTQKGYFGFGSSSNEQLYIVQQEDADITIYNGSASRWYYKTDGQYNSATDGGINVYGGGVHHSNDAVIYVDKTNDADWCIAANTGGNDYGIYARVGNSASYGLGVYDHTNTTWRFRVSGGGEIFAQNTTVQSISDQRLKENIVDANSQWDDIKGLRFRNYNWKPDSGYADAEGKTYLGLIAQEVESISPNLVEIDAQSKEDIENGVPDPEYKNVKYSIVWMKAVKALQEAQARIETLEAKVATLEGS